MMRVLAIDPGRGKCGVAVVEKKDGTIGYRAVLSVSELLSLLPSLIETYKPDAVLMGNGTCTKHLQGEIIECLPDLFPLHLVSENHTSERARKRFVCENPPRQWLSRLIPVSLRTPDKPYDDYVAVILAEDFFARIENAEA